MIALVTAAGEGRRMGGPKARLGWQGRTLLEAHVDAALEAGCTQVVVVVREAIARSFDGLVLPAGASLCISVADDAEGPAGSIATFVRATPSLADAGPVAVSPVDVVPRAWHALAALVEALSTAPSAVAARPLYAGRRGHPVLVRARTLRDHYATGAPLPLRDVFASHSGDVLSVPVRESAVLADLDTPDDLARWQG